MKPLCHPLRTAVLVGGLLVFTGCASMPEDTLQLAPQSNHHRELQTRHYDGVKEATLLAASAGVLQDLGFNLDESESKLGVVTASRKLTSHRPINGGEVAKSLAWGLLLGPYIAGPMTLYKAAAGVKEPQVVRVSLVTRSDGPAGGSSLRVTAQRVVYKDERLTNVTSVESLDDPLFYQEFFARISKSIFLEEQKT